MNASIITAPILEPITLDELKLHLRIDLDEPEENEYLLDLIKSAREHVEDITRRQLLTATWDYYLDTWPKGNFIKLPFGNLQNSVGPPSTAPIVSWKDDDGTSTTLTVTTDYLVETNGELPGRIVLPYGGTWPSGTLYPSNPITIRFVCGWTTAVLVPFKIKAAIKMICADLYEGRGEAVLGQTVSENKTVDRLLSSLRIWDEFEWILETWIRGSYFNQRLRLRMAWGGLLLPGMMRRRFGPAYGPWVHRSRSRPMLRLWSSVIASESGIEAI
jgi:uncharacterized phiE125 gp8 family phage protein